MLSDNSYHNFFKKVIDRFFLKLYDTPNQKKQERTQTYEKSQPDFCK